MGRKANPALKDEKGRYKSSVAWKRLHGNRGNNYYLSHEDNQLLKRAAKKLKMPAESRTEVIRQSLSIVAKED